MNPVVDELTHGKGGTYVAAHVRPVFADNGYCGVSLSRGLLRFHDSESGPVYRELVSQAFFELGERDVDVLAFDWQGRQYATVDAGLGDSAIWLVDIGCGRFDEVCSFDDFVAALSAN